MLKYKSLYIILLILPLFLGAESASTIQRSQEMLKDDKALRQKIEQEEKFFVKAIVLKGALKLSEEEIKDITVPFQGQWLTKKEIQQIIDSLKSAYEKKGVGPNRIKISYELKKDKTLEITVNELTN
jgi:hemolysin activation/secretion protein